MKKELFKKRIVLITVGIACLISCSNKEYAKEFSVDIQKKDGTPSSSQVLLVQRKAEDCLSSSFGNDLVYSPFSHSLVSLLYEGGHIEEVGSLVAEYNLGEDSSKVRTSAVFATTEDLDDSTIGRYLEHGINVFSGNIVSLENSLADHFGQHVSLGGNPGDYYLSSLSVEERFISPWETLNHSFDGNGSYSFAEKTTLGTYDIFDEGVLAEVPIGNVSMRFYLPEQNGVNNPLLLLQTPSQEGRVSLTIPEFKLESTIAKREGNGRYFTQESSFEFNRYGLKGKSFSINGPTAADPTYDFNLCLDRPFYFSCLCKGVHLFLGHVSSL